MKIAVDFDNVIYDYDGKWRGGELKLPPVPGAIEAMQQLAQDHTLIIFSTRGWLKKHRERMAAWMDSYAIPYHDIARTKPNADAYIDDKALRFTTWGEVLYLLQPGQQVPTHCEVAVFGLRQDDNAGRILRNADAFGAAHVHFVACHPTIRGMTGNVQHSVWHSADEFWRCAALDAVALHTRASLPTLTSLPPRLLLVLGGETQGLTREQLGRCRWQYHIPMVGSYGCLTADAACAIALHSWYMQWRLYV